MAEPIGDEGLAADLPVARVRLVASAPGERRIVMLNRFFVPDHAPTGQLLADLAAALAAAGVEVTVIASRHPARRRTQAASGSSRIRVVSVWSSSLRLPGILGRLAEYATFSAGAAVRLLGEVRPGDTLLVKTDPPLSCVLGWVVTRVRGAQLVNWCQDLFPEVAAALGIGMAGGPLGRAMCRLRNAAMRSARLNVAICERMAARLRHLDIPPDRLAMIPNWADALIGPVPHEHNRLRSEWQLQGKFVIGYAGNFGRSHDPAPLISLMERLSSRPETIFVIVGGGTGHERLRQMAAERQLRNVQFRPYQPPERLAETLSALDLHTVTLRPECEGLAFPSKLYSALAAGRPVLFIGDPKGDSAQLLAATGAGLCVAGDDGDALVAAVDRLRAEAEARGMRARAAFETWLQPELALTAWTSELMATMPVAARLHEQQP